MIQDDETYDYDTLMERFSIDFPHKNKTISHWELLNIYKKDPVFLDILQDFQVEIYDKCIEKINASKIDPTAPKGAGIAIPMGGGKSIISLILAINNCNDKPILIICSKSLISNWLDEIKKFFGDLSQILVYHSEFTKTKNILDYKPSSNIKIVITTPEVTAKSYKDNNLEDILITRRIENEGQFGQHEVVDYNFINQANNQLKGIIHSVNWGCCIVDEFHEYNNINVNRARSFLCIVADSYWPLSGTLFSEPTPNKILAYYRFIRDPMFPCNIPEAKRHLASDDFRGTNSSIISIDDLPIDVKTIVYHEKVLFNKDEERIYVVIRDLILEIKKEIDILKGEHLGDKIKILNGFLLSMLIYLRQSLVCPILPLASMTLNTFDITENDIMAEKFLQKIKDKNLNDYLNDPSSIISSRIQRVVDIVKKHKKIIIFTEFRTILEIVSHCIEFLAGKQVCTLSGDMSIKERNDVINKCRNSDEFILFLTYSIGSAGLNLQFADTVLLLDYSYNSSDTNQSVARLVRKGQKNTVNIYYLSSNSGVENAILSKHLDKINIKNELKIGKIVSTIKKIKTDEIVKILEQELIDEKINSIFINKR